MLGCFGTMLYVCSIEEGMTAGSVVTQGHSIPFDNEELNSGYPLSCADCFNGSSPVIRHLKSPP